MFELWKLFCYFLNIYCLHFFTFSGCRKCGFSPSFRIYTKRICLPIDLIISILYVWRRSCVKGHGDDVAVCEGWMWRPRCMEEWNVVSKFMIYAKRICLPIVLIISILYVWRLVMTTSLCLYGEMCFYIHIHFLWQRVYFCTMGECGCRVNIYELWRVNVLTLGKYY